MITSKKLNLLIGLYLSVLAVMLSLIVAVPFGIRHGIAFSRTFMMEEEVLESILLVVLFGVSYLIVTGFRKKILSYKNSLARSEAYQSRLKSRLSDAFSYIGTVNVEIREIQSILCGFDRYPKTKGELKMMLNQLANKAMLVAGTPWIVIRMIHRRNGRTAMEIPSERMQGNLPAATLGNREILKMQHAADITIISASRSNADLLTVCIVPSPFMGEDQLVLLKAIANQIEMLFLLFHSGAPMQAAEDKPFESPAYSSSRATIYTNVA